MQKAKEIGEQIREIADKYKAKLRYPVMSGTVIAGTFDESAMTVNVARTVDLEVDEGGNTVDGNGVPGVNINVVLNNMGGIYAVPADGADCLICEVDAPDKWELLKATSYTKVVIQAATLIQFNDGSLGGLPILQKIVDNNKAIHDYIKNTLEPAIKATITAVGVGSAANGPAAVTTTWDVDMAGQDITFEDMENVKIKQG